MISPSTSSFLTRFIGRRAGALALLAALLAPAAFAPAFANEQQELVDRATLTAETLLRDPDNKDFAAMLSRAKAVFIVPRLMRGAFFIGGEGGIGTLVARLPDGGWSAPAFFWVGGASIGLQIGGQSQEVMFFIMTEKGLNAIQSSKVTLGGDAGLSVAAWGKGVSASTAMGWGADIYAVGAARGLFAGGAVNASFIEPRDAWNRAYYGGQTAAAEVLGDRRFITSASANLRDTLASYETRAAR